MALPPEIAKHIVSYLSPVDLGRVAQLNKSWRNVVYSNSCWSWKLHKLWDTKPDSRSEFYSGLEIPSDARHLGEPTAVCFHDWLSVIRKTIHHSSIPTCVNAADTFNVYLEYFKKRWIQLGRPCIHTNHYKWYDVFRGRHFLRNMSVADQQRVFYRHCRFVVECKVVDSNPYRFWLQNHVEFSLGTRLAYPLHAPQIAPPKSDHPADIITASAQNLEHNRLVYLNTCRNAVFHKFHTALQKLRIYSKKEFDKKDKDMPWAELFSIPEKEGGT